MTTASTLNRFYTVAQVADRLEVSRRTVYRWIADSLLVVHRFGRQIRVSEPNLRAFIDARYQT